MHKFDNIYCINLKERPDRWESAKQQLSKIIPLDGVTRLIATKDQIGIRGCTHSHYRIIKDAKENRYKSILIFEDDFRVLDEDFDVVLNKSFNDLPEDWGVLYLGVNLIENKNKKISDNLIEVKYGKTTHAYAMSHLVYDYIIERFENTNWEDPMIWNYGNPNRMNIDVFYAREIQQKFKVYSTYPCLCDQVEGFSDILNRNVKYTSIKGNYDKL
jgi:GR25 family glycosyltransferase involved in LPS biosynthesis